jgi:flagellar hook-associated protein 2
MGSPITLSGFNDIDFNAVLEAVMKQESLPLTNLQTQQKALESKQSTFRTLAAKIATFESAVADLKDDSSMLGRTASSTDDKAVQVTAGGTAAPGIYDVVVQELARAQVTASTSTTPDSDATVVATGGTLTIGGVAVIVDVPVTLKGLADRINTTKDIGVTATVVKSGAGAYHLVLTARSTGSASQFTISNGMTGGAGITFGANSVEASDARALINNVQVVSTTNSITDAISGVSLSLLKKDPAATTTVTVTEDLGTVKTKINQVVDAFNDLVKFAEDQNTSAAKGDASSVGRDPLLRGLRNVLRSAFTGEYVAGGGFSSMASIGIEFQRTGRMTFSTSRFDAAAASNLTDIRHLFTGDGTNKGAFTTLADLVQEYTKADGLLKDTNDRLSQQVSALDKRIDDLTERLALRRLALQKEYIAADSAMTQLKNDVSSLSSLGGQYRLF